MKTVSKLAILESLDAMDHSQMEKLLKYIRETLLKDPKKDPKRSRQAAMEQIRKALQSPQTLRPMF
ncbi:MAG: hypothetical protein JNK10_02770 [Cyclobacteriaceae bacterium]|nr:hypothetical protein [Cyclobacteriaceae bacterium]